MKKCLAIGLVTAAMGASAALAEPVTVKAWVLEDPTKSSVTLAKEFEAKNPDIKIELKEVSFNNIVNDAVRAVATGTAPDIITIDGPEIAMFASRDLLLELDDLIAKSSIMKREDFFPGPLAISSWNDKVVAIPAGANTIALYYNADQFKEAGLDPDKPPQTWAELYDYAKKLTDPAKHRYGLAFSAIATEEGTFQFLPWIQTAGGNFDRLSDPGSIRALAFWQKLRDDKLVSPDVLVWRQDDAVGQLKAGNAAMAISGPWELPGLEKNGTKFDWRVALLPVEKEGAKRYSALGGFSFSIFKTSKHPKEAFRYLEYYYAQTERNWNEFGSFPVSQKAVPSDPKWPTAYAVFAEQMKYASGRGPHPQWPLISKAIQSAIQSALTHQTDAKAAMETAQASVNKVLKK